jgi:hypothetical protein
LSDFDWNKPFRAKNGDKAELLGTLNTNSGYPRIVRFTGNDGVQRACGVRLDGTITYDPRHSLENYEVEQACTVTDTRAPALIKAFDWNKPYRAESGRKAERIDVLTTRGSPYKNVIKYTHANGSQEVDTVQDGGSAGGLEHSRNLVNYEVERTMFAPIFRSPHGDYVGTLVPTESEAQRPKNYAFLGVATVTWKA